MHAIKKLRLTLRPKVRPSITKKVINNYPDAEFTKSSPLVENKKDCMPHIPIACNYRSSKCKTILFNYQCRAWIVNCNKVLRKEDIAIEVCLRRFQTTGLVLVGRFGEIQQVGWTLVRPLWYILQVSCCLLNWNFLNINFLNINSIYWISVA